MFPKQSKMKEQYKCAYDKEIIEQTNVTLSVKSRLKSQNLIMR